MSGLTLRVDPHVHSEASYDGHEPVELVLEQAADIGLDAVVITDHDVIDASLRAARLAPEYGLVGIPGVEVSTAHGHLLAIGVEEMPPPGRPYPETVARIRSLGGAAVAPHPFQRTRHGVRKRHLDDCDAIETYNAWLFTGWRNRRARSFARNRGFASVAGSDAHSLLTVGRAFTEIEFEDVRSLAAVDASDVVGAIKDGATAVHGRRAPLHRCASHYAKAATRKTGHALRSGVTAPVSLFH